MPKYIGRTERGRITREDSLKECVESIAWVANKDPAKVVALQPERGGAWYVYESQHALDVDAQRGQRVGWFGIINEEQD